MADSGFKYSFQPYRMLESSTIAIDPFIGVVDRAHAAKWGLHEWVEDTPVDGTDTTDSWPERGTAETDAFYAALEGTGAVEGCLQQASTALYGDDPVDDDRNATPARFKDVLEEQALASETMRSALEAWEVCMRAHGYADGSPAALRDRFVNTELEADPSTGFQVGAQADEIAAAIADMDCKDQTRFVDEYRAALWDAELKAIDEHRPMLEAYRERQLVFLEKATVILGEVDG
jgi:hypothetical protein